jgi:hypothetical protein
MLEFGNAETNLLKCVIKLGTVINTSNPSTGEAEAGGSHFQGQPELHSKFQASMDYIARLCLNNKEGHVIAAVSRRRQIP